MSLSIPLAALLTLAAPPEAPDGGAKAATIAPFLGEQVAAVLRLDLGRLDAPASLHRALGKLADDEDVADFMKDVDRWVVALRKAGAKELFVLLDPTDLPGLPTAVVPLAGGADANAIRTALSGEGRKGPLRWPSSEVVRDAVAAGTPPALARLRDAEPAARPEFAAALQASGDAAVCLAIVPSATQRRAIEESNETLPAALGGGPITTVSRGMHWASLSLSLEPGPALRGVVQASDAEAAKALRDVIRGALGAAAQKIRGRLALADLAERVGKIQPETEGDRIALEMNSETMATLVTGVVFRAREAARRTQCINNLKQIGLAMHNYHSVHGTFPAAFSAGKDGKPLLSWRVHILPFLDQNALYKEFHLDEPWDSAHNRGLISRMPGVYACPSAARAARGEGKTSYLTPRGPKTIFPGAEGIKLPSITDGTSNTLFIVDAGDDAAVVWTKPDDWDVAPALRTDRLFGHHPGGTNVGFADGSVRFLKATTDPQTWRALVTRNGGEVIKPEDF